MFGESCPGVAAMLWSCLAAAGLGGFVVEAEVEASGRLLLWALLTSWPGAGWGCYTGLLPAVAGEGNTALRRPP